MSQSLANFLFEALNFVLLATLLGYAFLKPVRRVLERERAEHAARAQQSEADKHAAEALLRSAQAAQASAQERADRQGRELVQVAQKEATDIVAEARRRQAVEAATAAAQREHAEQLAAAELAEHVGQLAAASVRSLLAQLDGPDLDLALVRGACAQLAAMSDAPHGVSLVESARPLTHAARALLEHSLPSGFEARTSSELGAGVRVTTPQGQVDATAAAIARRAAEALRERSMPERTPAEAAHA